MGFADGFVIIIQRTKHMSMKSLFHSKKQKYPAGGWNCFFPPSLDFTDQEYFFSYRTTASGATRPHAHTASLQMNIFFERPSGENSEAGTESHPTSEIREWTNTTDCLVCSPLEPSENSRQASVGDWFEGSLEVQPKCKKKKRPSLHKSRLFFIFSWHFAPKISFLMRKLRWVIPKLVKGEANAWDWNWVDSALLCWGRLVIGHWNYSHCDLSQWAGGKDSIQSAGILSIFKALLLNEVIYSSF